MPSTCPCGRRGVLILQLPLLPLKMLAKANGKKEATTKMLVKTKGKREKKAKILGTSPISLTLTTARQTTDRRRPR